MKSLDGVLIKRAHIKESYTNRQALELALCSDPINGSRYFMDHFFFIQHPTKGKLLYHPFDYQTELLENYNDNRFSVNLLGRQMGKTTTAAGYLLWYGMFVPDSTILIAAHKYAGAQEIMQRIRYAYESCPDHIRAGVVSYNKGSIEFDNGSRIVAQATTENTGRGMSISLLYCDEFAFVRPNIAKEFWTSISPTLATGGKAIITSTPNSDEDQFWLIWTEANKKFDEYGNEAAIGINGFAAYRAIWNRHPDRDEKWAREERSRIGEERFKREHETLPIIYDETLINAIKLSEMEGVDPVFTQGQVRWYKKPESGKTYVVALDPSLGTGGDNAAIQVFELPNMVQVAEWKHNKTPIPQQIRIIREINEYIVNETKNEYGVYYSVENNTLGEAALISIEEMGEENIAGIFLTEPTGSRQNRRLRKGFNTTNKSKIAACAKLKNLLESERLKVSSKALVSELKAFVAVGTSYEAKPGETDDLVMSLVLAVRMSMMMKHFDQDIHNSISDSLDDYILPMPIAIL